MKPKKLYSPSDNLKQFSITLQLPDVANYSSFVCDLLSNLTEKSPSNQKVLAIEKVTKALAESPLENDVWCVTQLLLETFLQLQNIDLLKKKLLWSLNMISERNPTIYYKCMEEVLKSKLTCNLNTETLLNTLVLVVEKPELVFTDASEEFPLKNSYITFKQECCIILLEASGDHMKYLWSCIENPETSSLEANSLFHALHQITKYLGILLKTETMCSEKAAPQITADALQQLLLRMASSVIVPLDLRSSCGLLYVQIEIACKKSLVVLFQHIYSKKNRFESVEDLGQMSVFHGLLCCMEAKLLFTPLSLEKASTEEDLASHLLKRLHSTISTTHCSSSAVIICRIFNNLLIRLLDFVTNVELSDEIFRHKLCNQYSLYSSNTQTALEVIWLLWDHYLDNVKHIAKESFIVLIKVQTLINREEAVSYFTKLAISLTQALTQKRSFRALTCLIPFIDVNSLIRSNPEIVNRMFKMLSDPTYASYSADLLEALLTKHHSEIDYEDWNDFWLGVFFNNFSKEMLVYGYESLLEKLLLLSDDIPKAISLLVSSEELCDLKLCLLIICAKISMKTTRMGRKNCSFPALSSSLHSTDEPLWKDVIPFYILVSSLASEDESLKILAYGLLCDNCKSTALYDYRELEALKTFIVKNIDNQNLSFRQKLINNTKKALSRILKGLSAQVKIFSSVSDKLELNKLVIIYINFIRDLFQFLTHSICIGASFFKRSASLRIMELVFEVINDDHFCHLKGDIFSRTLKDSLILCLNDSYEDNKIIALKLLTRLSESGHFSSTERTNEALMKSVWKLASSPKSPDSLTASYLLAFLLKDSLFSSVLKNDFPAPIKENNRLLACSALLVKLEKETCIAQASLFEAATSAPMYGLLLCLRHLFANLEPKDVIGREHLWATLVKKILASCFVIAKAVSSVVANSSPEGHLPMDLTESSSLEPKDCKTSSEIQESEIIALPGNLPGKNSEEDRAVTAQMLLVCGWRSIKEVSLLFGNFIQGSSEFDILTLLSVEDVESIGTFFMTQLTETKHRGAFEQAYSGFVMICNKLWHCTNKINKLPEIWLTYIIEAIQDERSTRFCATRRSAGVPFIIQAIISTEPGFKGGASLKTTMETLFQLAESELGVECKVHVLNILRTLFRDAKIGEEVIPYASRGVKLAVEGYEDSSWSIRNSSSLMFASLVNRMLGVKKTQEDLHSKNAVSAFAFFKRYSDLHGFFLKKMATSVAELDKGELASSFPLLMLLARLSQTSSEGFSSSIPLTPFIPLVLNFNSSPVYQLRCLASRALIPLIIPFTVVDVIEQLCLSVTLENQNHLHGSLLCLIRLFESFKKLIMSSEQMKERVSTSLCSVIWIMSEANPCLFTRACGANLFTYLIRENILSFSRPLKSLVAESLSYLSCSFHNLSHVPGATLANMAFTSFFLTVYENRDQELLLNLLSSPVLEVKKSVLQHILSIDFGQALTNKILFMLKTREEHPDCVSLLYNLLTKCLASFEQENYSLHRNNLNEIFVTILDRLNSEIREEFISSLTEASYAIMNKKIKFGDQPDPQVISRWTELVATFMGTDYSFDVQLTAAEVLSSALANLHSNSHMPDEIELPLIRIVIDLLLDEDRRIQVVAVKGTNEFLKGQKRSLEGNADHLTPTSLMTLVSLISYVASKTSNGYFSLLLYLALREVDEIHMPQEIDGAFERGKTRSSKEQLPFTEVVSRCMNERLSHGKKHGHVVRPQVELGIIINRLLIASVHDSLNNQETNELSELLKRSKSSVSDFLRILKKEIEFILRHLSPLVEISPFELRYFDHWIERLARRALLWSTLKKNSPEYIGHLDETLLFNFKSSLTKPIRFNQIVEWLC